VGVTRIRKGWRQAKITRDVVAGWIVKGFVAFANFLSAIEKEAVTTIKSRFGRSGGKMGYKISTNTRSILDSVGVSEADAFVDSRFMMLNSISLA
jgi:hypothetical protein